MIRMRPFSILKTLGVGIAFAVVVSCESPTEPLPEGAIAFTAPPAYEVWWHQVEACAGRSSDFHAIAWYEVPGGTVFTVGSDSRIEGYWQPYHSSITLAGMRLNDSLLVRHEELHAILHTIDHPPEYFADKCGTLVAQ